MNLRDELEASKAAFAAAVERAREEKARAETAEARVTVLEAALEEADSALSCVSCAEDSYASCPDHGDIHAKIATVLKGGTS